MEVSAASFAAGIRIFVLAFLLTVPARTLGVRKAEVESSRNEKYGLCPMDVWH